MFTVNFIALVDSLNLKDLDLFAVGVAAAVISIVGIVIYLNNRNSITNRTFAALSAVATLWSVASFASRQTADYGEFSLWLSRFELFFLAWFAYYFFKLTHVIPVNEKAFPKWYRFNPFLLAILGSFLAFVPFVFSGPSRIIAIGPAFRITISPCIVIFVIVTIILVFGGFLNLVKKLREAKKSEKNTFRLALAGSVISLVLITAFDLVFPVVFLNAKYIPLGGFFAAPLLAFTACVIFNYRLFSAKNVATAILAFFLCLVTFFDFVIASGAMPMLFRATVFFITLTISIKLFQNIFELEAANEKKAEFMYFASHALRSPITSIKICSELLLEGGMGKLNPDIKNGVQKILVSTNNTIALIAQYLNKIKMELNHFTYFITTFDVAQTIRAAVDKVLVNADQKGVFVTLQLDEKAIINVRADENKTREVIGNILDNAVKFTKTGGVLVTVKDGRGKIVIKIADTGAGIDSEMMPLLFKAFSKEDVSNNILGSGLGLFLSKTFIDAMGGRIWAESEGEGQGSQFYIELPKK